MLGFIKANIANIIIVLLLIIIVALIIRKIIKDKNQGKSCCGECNNCSSSCSNNKR